MGPFGGQIIGGTQKVSKAAQATRTAAVARKAESDRYWKDPPPSSSIPSAIASGLRSDVYLVADAAAIASIALAPYDPCYSWTKNGNGPLEASPKELLSVNVNAVDTTFDPTSRQIADGGFAGVLKVHVVHLPTTFWQRLWPPGQSQGPEPWWSRKQSIAKMFEKAHVGKANGGRQDDVWPPEPCANWDLGVGSRTSLK